MRNRNHVVLNAQLLAADAGYRNAGISHYIFNLINALPKVSDGIAYTVLVGPRRPEMPGAMRVLATRWPTHRPVARILWEQLAQPILLRKIGAELYHGLGFTLPILGTRKSVVTVYDLSFLHFPDAFKPWKQFYLSLFVRMSARKADRVIAISEHTRRDVIRLWKVPGDRVSVAYGGVSPDFRPLPPEDVSRFKEKHGIPEKFFLYLGTLEPRKNLPRLVEAYARAYGQDRSLPPLVIAGARGWYYDEIFARVQALALEDRVFFPGFIPEEDLVLWYNAAEVFVYPSLYEGFGLPVLEAMACGKPVISSNAASLPEVVGEAGVMVPPEDVHALGQAMLSLWRDLDWRRSLASKAAKRARCFSWEETARATVAAYRAVFRER